MATAATPNQTEKPADSNQGNPRKRKVWLLVLLLLVVLGAIGVWGWYELYGRFNENTDDAYVNGNVVEITPLTTGTVISIGAAVSYTRVRWSCGPSGGSALDSTVLARSTPSTSRRSARCSSNWSRGRRETRSGRSSSTAPAIEGCAPAGTAVLA